MTNAEEIEKFSKDAPQWWDESGPFAPLHRLNPVRMAYIRDMLCGHFFSDENAQNQDFNALSGLSVLDVGCGGGLVCEPLARLGAAVTGLDADPVAIGVAQDHAAQTGLDITYMNDSVDSVEVQFDAVLALEIIEHVDDPAAFIERCSRCVKPGGLLIVSTLNKTPKSWALGIMAAEYILRWVPKGTHDWHKFVRPSRLSRWVRDSGLTPFDITGLVFKPLQNSFALSDRDIDVNYFLAAHKS